MYNILFLLILSVLGSAAAFGGYPTHIYSSSIHRSAETHKPAHVQRVNQGPVNDPSLPNSQSNAKPVAVADRPNDVSLRRRKLNLRFRH